LQRLGQRVDCLPGVGLDRHGRLPVAAKLERVDIDLDQPRVVRKGQESTLELLHAGADRDQQIGRLVDLAGERRAIEPG
jgi:hypothetical protein